MLKEENDVVVVPNYFPGVTAIPLSMASLRVSTPAKFSAITVRRSSTEDEDQDEDGGGDKMKDNSEASCMFARMLERRYHKQQTSTTHSVAFLEVSLSELLRRGVVFIRYPKPGN